MTVSKTAGAESLSNAAGGTTVGTVLDLQTADAAGAVVAITNGATGPTLPMQVVWQGSNDNVTWYDLDYPSVAGTGSSTTWRWPFYFGRWAPKYVRPVYSGNTGQAVTFSTFWTIATGA